MLPKEPEVTLQSLATAQGGGHTPFHRNIKHVWQPGLLLDWEWAAALHGWLLVQSLGLWKSKDKFLIFRQGKMENGGEQSFSQV